MVGSVLSPSNPQFDRFHHPLRRETQSDPVIDLEKKDKSVAVNGFGHNGSAVTLTSETYEGYREDYHVKLQTGSRHGDVFDVGAIKTKQKDVSVDFQANGKNDGNNVFYVDENPNWNNDSNYSFYAGVGIGSDVFKYYGTNDTGVTLELWGGLGDDVFVTTLKSTDFHKSVFDHPSNHEIDLVVLKNNETNEKLSVYGVNKFIFDDKTLSIKEMEKLYGYHYGG